MTQTIAGAVTAVAAVIGGISGIEAAPATPPENTGLTLFAVTYLSSSEVNIGPIGTRKHLASISVDLVKVRRDLSLDIATLLPYTDSIPQAMLQEFTDAGDRFSNTMETFEKLTIEFMPIYEYQKVQMIGYRFTMENVKLLINL
jgi:hypothetical protein